jgi:hypothetical protein
MVLDVIIKLDRIVMVCEFNISSNMQNYKSRFNFI